MLDSSALVAIPFGNADASPYVNTIANALSCRISATGYLEAAVVVESKSETGGSQFDALIRCAKILIEPVMEEQAVIARQAYADHGKSRHRAGLKFGHCFSFPLAKASGDALLFKGEVFGQTRI